MITQALGGSIEGSGNENAYICPNKPIDQSDVSGTHRRWLLLIEHPWRAPGTKYVGSGRPSGPCGPCKTG